MFRNILVPVDFTKKNLRAVRVAARLATGRKAMLTLLHVIERVDGGDPRALAGFYRRLEASARKKMGSLRAAAGSLPTHAEILYGNRVNEILRFATDRKIDLIVMSSHRLSPRNAGEHWGTISHKVGILSRCPALLVK
ncbi:MAG TPA: universal stress protein [Thermoanaerobaculia bacterium]|jgi:nucleotide-binding universal stress UspA family protein